MHEGYVVIENVRVVAFGHDRDLLSYVTELVSFVIVVNMENFDCHLLHMVDSRLVEAVRPPDDTISAHSNRSIEPVGLLI